MYSNNTKLIAKCITVSIAGLVAAFMLLVFGFFFAKEIVAALSLCAGVIALASATLLVVAIKFYFLPGEREKRNQANEELLNRFTCTEFINRYGDVVSGSSKPYAFLCFCLPEVTGRKAPLDLQTQNDILAEICTGLRDISKGNDRFARCMDTQFEGLFCYETEVDIFDFINHLGRLVHSEPLIFGISLEVKQLDNLYTHEEKARLALLKAKSEGSRYETARTASKDILREYILKNMQRALDENEFVMYLQPEYNLTTNEVCGADALVRWVRKDGSILLPQEMISVFEETGFIVKVDAAILRQACIKIREWINTGRKPIPISIKISKLHILNKLFIQSLDQMISEYKIPSNLLEFDISQTSISVTVDKLIALDRQFDGHEALVSFDDSGSGISSIKALQGLPANTIRCNGDLFSIASKNAKIYDMLLKTINIFNEHDVTVVAESIETAAQLETVKKLNCHYALGFYFSGPIAASNFDKIAFKP